MPLTLENAHYFVRNQIGELEEYRWKDSFINFALNNRAQEFYSAGNMGTQTYQVQLTSTASGGQEGLMPVELDYVKSVKYYAGQLFPLEYHDWSSIQTGAYTGSIPLYYYVKTDTTQLSPQTAGSNITVTNLEPQLPQGFNYQQTIGVWPVITTATAQSTYVQLFCSVFHPFMDQPQSVSSIPRMFLDGWAAGAISDCLRIEKAYAEADMWEQRFQKRKEDYRIYASQKHKSDKMGQYGVPRAPWRESASSSIILVDQFPTM